MKHFLQLKYDSYNTHIQPDSYLKISVGNKTTSFEISDYDRVIEVSNDDLRVILSILKDKN
jgi:hypothetical protein